MKALCFLIPLLLYITKFICSHHLNVGTVLFTKSHLYKKCWTDSEMKLLSARQVMQGVLPDPDFIDISKTGTITVLLEYFQSCFEAIGQSTCRKTQHLMFLALADALGGYFRTYILPLTRQGYYAGHIKYFEARKAYQFYEELKEFLKTNGAGWAMPHTCTLNCKIRPLKISTRGCDSACAQLYLRDEGEMEVSRSVQNRGNGDLPTELPTCPLVECEFHDKGKIIDMIEGMRNQKDFISNANAFNNIDAKLDLDGRNIQKIEKIRKSVRRNRDRVQTYVANSTICREENDIKFNVNNSSMEGFIQGKSLKKRSNSCGKKPSKKNGCFKKQLIVPLPMLDDPITPRAIGLPFRVRPLRSLCSPHSISILVRYYITVVRCLVSKTNNKCDFCNFNAQFRSWLISNVFPHLADEEWYPAFGGVLRIDETIKSFGVESFTKCKSSCATDIGYIFSKGCGIDESDYADNEECPEIMVPPCTRKEDKKYFILGIVIIVLIWVLAFCYCICCHCSNIKGEKEDPNETLHDPVDKKKADPSNSFIIQYLVKFFRRSEEKKDFGPEKENIVYNVCEGKMSAVNDREHSDKSEVCQRSVDVDYGVIGSGSKEKTRRTNINNRETIVLPAQVNPMATDVSMGFNSFWPFANFRDDVDIGNQYRGERLKCLFDRKEPLSKMQRWDKEQFRTLWKREKSDAPSSDSCECLNARNAEGRNVQPRPKRKADVLSRSSCSQSQSSTGSDKRRVIFLRRSFSGSGRCSSCNSSSASYSPSQAEDDTRTEFFHHVAACHNYFAKKALIEGQKPKRELDRKKSLTSSSSTEESFRQ